MRAQFAALRGARPDSAPTPAAAAAAAAPDDGSPDGDGFAAAIDLADPSEAEYTPLLAFTITPKKGDTSLDLFWERPNFYAYFLREVSNNVAPSVGPWSKAADGAGRTRVVTTKHPLGVAPPAWLPNVDMTIPTVKHQRCVVSPARGVAFTIHEESRFKNIPFCDEIVVHTLWVFRRDGAVRVLYRSQFGSLLPFWLHGFVRKKTLAELVVVYTGWQAEAQKRIDQGPSHPSEAEQPSEADDAVESAPVRCPEDVSFSDTDDDGATLENAEERLAQPPAGEASTWLWWWPKALTLAAEAPAEAATPAAEASAAAEEPEAAEAPGAASILSLSWWLSRATAALANASAPAELTEPADAVAPADPSAPADEATPADAAASADVVAPVDAAIPADAAPADTAAADATLPADAVLPADAADSAEAPPDAAIPVDTAAPAAAAEDEPPLFVEAPAAAPEASAVEDAPQSGDAEGVWHGFLNDVFYEEAAAATAEDPLASAPEAAAGATEDLQALQAAISAAAPLAAATALLAVVVAAAPQAVDAAAALLAVIAEPITPQGAADDEVDDMAAQKDDVADEAASVALPLRTAGNPCADPAGATWLFWWRRSAGAKDCPKDDPAGADAPARLNAASEHAPAKEAVDAAYGGRASAGERANDFLVVEDVQAPLATNVEPAPGTPAGDAANKAAWW